MTDVAVYGAGGHAKVVADALLSEGARVIAFLDDAPALAGARRLGVEVHGFAWLVARLAEGPMAVALGIGDNHVRARLAAKCREAGATIRGARHRSAVVAESAEIGEGTVLMAGAIVNPDARVGAGVIVNTGAIVEHDATVGDFAHLSPGAVMAGGSRLGAFSSLGAGATILDDVLVGDGVVVGGNALVNRHLPDQVVAYGVPARVRRELPSRGTRP